MSDGTRTTPDMSPRSEFGWPAHAEDPEAYWEQQEKRQREEAREANEQNAQRHYRQHMEAWREPTRDSLSYVRTHLLEWEAGVRSGPWWERLKELRAALKADEGREANAQPANR